MLFLTRLHKPTTSGRKSLPISLGTEFCTNLNITSHKFLLTFISGLFTTCLHECERESNSREPLITVKVMEE